MKKILILLLLISFNSYSQEIVGTWKITSYEDETLYYHKAKDSIAYKDASKADGAEKFKTNTAPFIFAIAYRFDTDGNYVMDNPLEEITGTYTIDKKAQKIIMIEEGDKRSESSYEFKNNTLFLNLDMEGMKETYIKLGLEKVIN